MSEFESAPSNEDVLHAIAQTGSAIHALRHLEAHKAMGEMDAYQVAYEVDVDPETASAMTIAETFVEEFDAWRHDVMPPGSDQFTEWRRGVTEKYGHEAREYLEAAHDSPASPDDDEV